MVKSGEEKKALLRKFRSQAILVTGAAFLVYLLLANILAVFQVYRLDKEIIRLRQEIAELKIKNQDLENLIAYLKTDSFKEREARRKLNYRKPGERVLVIPDQTAFVERKEEEEASSLSPEERLKNLPTPYKWWYYFFGV